MTRNHKILGVSEDASQQEIKNAFIRLAKIYHPDSKKLKLSKEEKARKFEEIRKAYLILSGQTSIAQQVVNNITKAKAERLMSEDKVRAQAQFAAGVKAMNNKRFSDAVKYFNMAVELDPMNATYFSNLSLALIFQGSNLHQAEKAARKAIELEPENGVHYFHLGLIYKKAGINSRALQYFQKAEQLKPALRREIERFASDLEGYKQDAISNLKKILKKKIF